MELNHEKKRDKMHEMRSLEKKNNENDDYSGDFSSKDFASIDYLEW